MTTAAIYALRTAAGRHSCNRRASWALSLSLLGVASPSRDGSLLSQLLN
jgi:hypothetical protein